MKTTMKYHLLSERLSSINQQTTSAGEDVEKGEPFCTAGRNADWCSHCGKQYGDTSKFKMDLPFDPAIPLLRIYPKKPKTLIQKNISTSMFIAALCTISKIWKQPKDPSVDEWIKQLWDSHTMEYYLAIKKSKVYSLLQYGCTWRTVW